MKILLTGATGFLGRHIAERLAAEGHHLRCAVRDVSAAQRHRPLHEYVRIEFARALEPAAWHDALAGVDLVINAVGILRESPGQRFDELHRRAPAALFSACVDVGVGRVINISALGADADARSAYHLSKRAADEFLFSLPLDAVVLQPSLVYGADGTSARLFGLLASLPLIPLPAGGCQQVQPVHVDDVVDALAAVVHGARPADRRVALVGPKPLALRDFLGALRSALGIRRRPRFVAVPRVLAIAGATLGERLPGVLLNRDTLAMLERGNTASATAITTLLGHPPRAVQDFVPPPHRTAERARATLSWLLPTLRASIGVVWIVTGLVSFGLYPVADSYALLARAGVPPSLQPLALYGAATLDLVLGVLCFVPRHRRLVWLAQAALIAGYTLIISWKLPEYWLHPYGPVLKNLPLLVAIWLLYEFEERS